MINVDTDRLLELMNLLQQATNDIDRATSTLTSITTHDGWACKERYRINDYIISNRNMIKTLQDHCNSFCRVAKDVADDLVETENGISEMFAGVEGAIATILSDAASISSIFEKINIIPMDNYHGTLPSAKDLEHIITSTSAPAIFEMHNDNMTKAAMTMVKDKIIK